MTETNSATGNRLVHPTAIEVDVAAADPRACIEHLVDLAAATGRVTDRDAVLTAVLEREANAPTGLGAGVAVPHARTAFVDRPTLGFVRLETGVDFGGPDDADLVFLLAVPEEHDDVHLETLRRLSLSLLESSLGARLRAADSPAAVAAVLEEVIG